ncbi:SpaA isopeptide-forming pilin-related protein [Lawsonibacter sp. LCP25S3_G6]|uniref:SpaA isopeptide-forming pilin-related protein n=1 Tax=unclassified Lawsonibacter TaxID=2617946 RepID=UPI003F9C2509
MKALRTRIMSAFLVIMTLLTLLQTSALAASGSGTGIKPTDNTNYWTTRLLHDGTPYSYKPPMAAGKLLYCLDRGYGYRWGTASFLNSYTYTSATGADADTVLKTALAQSGMGELDAQQLENFKWMMTYIVDYKGEIPGSLFMAAQTYVWDHQTFKGEGDGDIDAGGFANADTYETYLGYIDWMLKEKAKEDAEFQKQIEKYAAQGTVATVVEDDAAKWAVFAKSSVKGRQSFFGYYAPRKLVTTPTQPGEPDRPPAGDADITLKKVAAGTTQGLDGAVFNIYRDGQIVGSAVTKNGGIIEVNDITKGLWTFVETEAPAGYCTDPTPHSVYVDTTDGDKQYTVTAENHKLPDMKITKRDAMSGNPIAGTVFSIKSVTGNYSTSVTTGVDGSATLSSIPADVYVVREESVPEPYIVTNTEQTVALRPGKTSEVTFVDYEKPGLEIIKKNIANGEPIEGVTYRIEQIDGSFSTSATTDGAGRIFLASIPVGSYRITEKNVPSHVILSEIPQEVYLEAGCTRTVTFFNAVKPSLTILKRNSVTGDPLSNAKFHIYYGSDNTTTGEINDLGVFTTASDGKITLTDVNRGWYKLVEESAPKGFGIQGSGVTEFYLEANTSKTVTVDNVPHSALVVYKYDAKTGKGLEGCRFELRYLSGNTSGTGGTVIGTYVTGPNGAFTVTNLKKGTYVCQELESDGNHIIDREPQTVWISGEDQDVVTLRFGNAPLGSLLITKLSDDSKHEPLSGVEFLLTDSSGHYLGNDNGRFTTNAAGEILVDGLEPGMTVIAREVRAKTGYLLDDSPQHALIKSGETAHLQFLNQPAGNLIIRKVSTGPNKEPLEGVEFKITYADGSFVPDANGELSSNGIYYTNKSGEIRISGIVGTVVATETKTIPGFTIDEATRTQTVVVNPNDTQTLTFYNKPTTTLILQKYISGTKNEPLAGVQFLVTDSSGAVVGPNNGYYTTDAAGQIVIEGLTDGMTVTAKEVKSVDGFVLDGTPQRIKIDQSQSPQRLTFWNERQGALIINKLSSLDRKTPLEGVTFKITTATGEFVPDENGKISSNGLYYTNESGQIILKGVTGTLVVTEEKSIDGYTIDENTRTQTVVVNPDDTQSLYFYNAPIGGVELIKVNAADETQRIPNTTFEIRRVSDGGLVDTVITGTDGRVYVPLASGSYYAVETKAGKGFQLDSTPVYFTVEDGKTTTKTVTNKAISGILIHKVNAVTGEGIPGVSFLLYDSGNNPIAQETSDDRGYVRFEGLEDGRYYLRELENEGYIPDTQKKTVYVKSGETTEIEWKNTPITGQIQVAKVSADYNSMNGWPAGAPIPNTVFEIYNARTNRLVDTIRTDKNGLAVSKPLPLARYKIVESKAAEFYGLDKTPIEVEIEYAGQIVKASMTNKSLSTNVSIKKTGYVEVMPGQLVRYNFADIANNSTTALESFYWRDTLPIKAVRLQTIYTGTWNTPGNYKIVYKTNLSGESWRTLADNLSTSKNYVLDASPAALGLAANEYVTEFMASFGIVPANFRQVEPPRVDCKALAKLTGGTQFVNQADAGGVYNGQWIMATSRWVTRVYAPSKPLPRTGY